MPDVEKIRQSLVAHKIDDSVIQRIMEGVDAVPSSRARKAPRAAFLISVMKRLDEALDRETCETVMDWCACCKGGVRERNIKKLVGETRGKTLAEKVEALRDVPNMGKPVLNADGTITCGITWQDGDFFRCPCPIFNGLKLEEPVPVTYCYCCAGHFRHHYQKALGVQLKIRAVLSSPLESLGQRPCRFVYEILE